MLRVLKYVGFTILALVLLICVVAGGVYVWGGRQATRVVALPTHDFSATNDPAAVARGEHFVKAIGKCTECHTPDLGGGSMIDDPMIGQVWSANLTRGQGGIGADFGDAQFERAIRHGLAANGRRLVLMPSNEFQFISDDDLKDIIAYIRSAAPVDRDRRALKVGPLARALYAAGLFPLFPAEMVTHRDEVVATVPVDSTAAYGKYVADIGCSGCHGVTYGGGPIPGAPPEWPAPANLTPTGIGHYTFEQFQHALRDGMKAAGTPINPFMPIQATKLMTDTEIKAVWNYLHTLPPKEFGSR